MRCKNKLLLSSFACAMSLQCSSVFALDLAQAEARLLNRNHDILAAQRGYESATASIAIAGQAPNPTLSYSAVSIDTRNGVGSGALKDKRIDQTVAIQQQFERGDRRQLRTDNAESLSRAARADLADVRRQQRLALHQAWFDALAANERLRLLNETAALYKRALEAADIRVKVGDLARVDASRLRIEALRAQSDARTARADADKARRAVADLLAEDNPAAIEIEPGWPEALTPKTITAFDHRPAVQAAAARVDAAAHNRNLARSLTTRDVTIGGSVERKAPEIGVTYGVSVSIPLFVRYGYEGEQAKAEVEYTAALEARERALHQAASDAHRTAVDLSAALERMQRIDNEALKEAREVATASEFAYSKGALSLTDLLDARRTLRAVEQEAVASRADYAKARAAWLAATEWESLE